jgi:hypothetical protein
MLHLFLLSKFLSHKYECFLSIENQKMHLVITILVPYDTYKNILYIVQTFMHVFLHILIHIYKHIHQIDTESLIFFL